MTRRSTVAGADPLRHGKREPSGRFAPKVPPAPPAGDPPAPTGKETTAPARKVRETRPDGAAVPDGTITAAVARPSQPDPFPLRLFRDGLGALRRRTP